MPQIVLLAGPISRTGIQYMDFVDIFSVSLDLSAIYILLILGGAELSIFIVVTLS